jgi:hypothetical protein
MTKGSIIVIGLLTTLGLWSTTVRAEGCYVCGPGSTPVCGHFCRYQKDDTFEARKECQQRGCKIHGKGPCPAEPKLICSAPSTSGNITVASIPWCAGEQSTNG